MLVQMLGDQRLEQIMDRRLQIALLDQDGRQGAGFVFDPSADGGDQSLAGDEFHLQRQDPKQQILVAISRHQTSPQGNWFSRSLPTTDNSTPPTQATTRSPLLTGGFLNGGTGPDSGRDVCAGRVTRKKVEGRVHHLLERDPSLISR